MAFSPDDTANQSTENTDELAHARWVRIVAGIFVYGLGGLVVTPVLTMFIGWLLFGHRGTCYSFVVFMVAVYATPFGALYWAVVVPVWRLLIPNAPFRLIILVALPLYLVGLVATLLILGGG